MIYSNSVVITKRASIFLEVVIPHGLAKEREEKSCLNFYRLMILEQ
jgi:hypothetical protein